MKKLLLLLALLATPLVMQVPPLEILKLKTFDYLVPEYAPSGNFVILDITEEEVRAEGGWPLPRQRLAEIHQEILQKGALGVGWVLSFVDKDRFGGDSEYILAVSQSSSSIVATFSFDNQQYPKPTGTVILGPDVQGITLPGHLPNIEGISDYVLEGVVSAPVDIDNLVRRLPLLYQMPDGS